MSKQKIIDKIDDLIDHWTPYRTITDSPEAVKVREVLGELREFVIQNN